MLDVIYLFQAIWSLNNLDIRGYNNLDIRGYNKLYSDFTHFEAFKTGKIALFWTIQKTTWS